MFICCDYLLCLSIFWRGRIQHNYTNILSSLLKVGLIKVSCTFSIFFFCNTARTVSSIYFPSTSCAPLQFKNFFFIFLHLGYLFHLVRQSHKCFTACPVTQSCVPHHGCQRICALAYILPHGQVITEKLELPFRYEHTSQQALFLPTFFLPPFLLHWHGGGLDSTMSNPVTPISLHPCFFISSPKQGFRLAVPVLCCPSNIDTLQSGPWQLFFLYWRLQHMISFFRLGLDCSRGSGIRHLHLWLWLYRPCLRKLHRMLSKSISELARTEWEKQELDVLFGTDTMKEALEEKAKNKTLMQFTIQGGGIRWANAPVICWIH